MKELKTKEVKNGFFPGPGSFACLHVVLLVCTWFSRFARGLHLICSSNLAALTRLPCKCAGRLAMVAMLGYSGQAVMTGVGPFQNLTDHLGNPSALLSSLVNSVLQRQSLLWPSV